MRVLGTGALTSAVLTFVAALALHGADAAVAVLAVAAVVVLLSWYAQLSSDDGQAGLDVVSPAFATTLAAVGRRPWATILPCYAAHAVGAVVGGLGALALDSSLPGPLLYDADSLVVAGAAGAVVGLVGAWAALAADGGGPVALTAVPVVLGGGALPVAFVGAFSPAVVLGLATAELISWPAAGVAASAGLIAAGLGAWLVGAFVPATSE